MDRKRRDRRKRVLRDGEYQEKNGRYKYSYTDRGHRKSVYSWKLEKNDPLPAGKRPCVSLRDKIKIIEKTLQLQKFGYAYKELTVYELVERYTRLKRGVRSTTRAGYRTVLHFLEKDPFGKRRVEAVRVSDAKLFLIELQENGKSYSSIHQIRGVLRPAFQMAVDDDFLMKNPFDFQLVDVVINDSIRREALTRDQERKLLEFIKNDRHFSRYYEGIYILFKTGMRISEFCGLTLKDIDMNERVINIDHQLIRESDMKYKIVPTKTESGTRKLPMTNEVYECFRVLIARLEKRRIDPIIDGYTSFLFLDKNRMPCVALHWEKYFERICAKYNKIYKQEMPKVTPHICRHTYCTNMAKSGMNPKALQYLMGHSDITITLNVYTHLKFEDAKAEVIDMSKRVGA